MSLEVGVAPSRDHIIPLIQGTRRVLIGTLRRSRVSLLIDCLIVCYPQYFLHNLMDMGSIFVTSLGLKGLKSRA